jgi:hypothetical protein
MRRLSRWCVLACFPIVLVFLSGCDKPINLVVGQSNKIALYPTAGPHLVWLNGIQVQFLGLSPCTETGEYITECHVKSGVGSGKLTQFFYICKDYACSDPEVDVGGGSGGTLHNYTARTRSTNLMDSVGVYCSGASATLAPADLPSSSQNAPLKPGMVVNWLSLGGITDWTVTFDASGVCDEPSITSGGNTMCTIKQGLTPGKYTYKATSTSCTTAAPGSLTTVAP